MGKTHESQPTNSSGFSAVANAGLLSSSQLLKASARFRKCMGRLATYLSPIDMYVAMPETHEPLGLIALNAGVQAGVSPFALRQAFLARQTHLTEDSFAIYFTSALPFALIYPTSSESLLVSVAAHVHATTVSLGNAISTVYMLSVPNIWTGGSSPNSGLLLLYLLCCKADLVLDALSHVFQPPTIGVEIPQNRNMQRTPTENGAPSHFRFCESVEKVPGLYIVRDFITQEEHDEILRELKGANAPALDVEVLSRRSVAHFNRKFYYGVNRVGKIGEFVNAKPAFYDWMQRRLRNEDSSMTIKDYPLSAKKFFCDQLTVNFYNYNEDTTPPGIAHHVDSHSAFMDCVFIVSLGSHTVLEFSRYDRPPGVTQPTGVFVAPRSMLLMTGEARYGWTHCISEKRVDFVSDRLPPLRRADRVSLTWRRGRDAPHFCDDCMFKVLCDGGQ